MTLSKNAELALECKRLSESSLYTSTTFYIWLRVLKRVRLIFIIAPLVLGSLAGWNLLAKSDLQTVKILTAACAFLAGLLPTIYAALKLDQSLEQFARLAGEFKNLQDRFRQAAQISSRKPFNEFEAEIQPLIERLEQARIVSLTPPEWVFKSAQKKVKSTDYDFDVDIALLEKGKGVSINPTE